MNCCLDSSFPGRFYSGQSSSGSGLRTAASRVGSFLWQVLTSPGEWGAARGGFSSTFLLSQHLPSPRAVCGGGILFPCGSILGGGGGCLCRAPRLRLGCSPGSSVRGVAALGAGGCLAPPHWHGSPPGQRPLLQVSVVGGRRGGENLQSPARVGWVPCAAARLGFAFPLVPIRRSAAVGKAAAVLQAPLSSPCPRRYPWLKRSLLLLLLLLLLAAAAYGESAHLDLWP